MASWGEGWSEAPPEGIPREALWAALRLVGALNEERRPGRLLEGILDAAVTLIGGERGFIILDEAGELRIRAARNFDQESLPEPETKISTSIARSVIASGEVAVLEAAAEHPLFSTARSVRQQKLKSVLCAPLRIEDATCGAIYLDNRWANTVFGEPQRELLRVFAAQAGVALTAARRMAELAERGERLERLNAELAQRNDESQEVIVEQRSKIEALDRELLLARDRAGLSARYQQIRGDSAPLRKMLGLVDRVADSDETVLIMGETGTGKELVARALHANSSRRRQRFVAINCPEISAELLESELFGHVKHSWTGAHADRDGLFVAANKGTIFLDEVTEMPLDLQAKLLRVLQEREVRPVGANTPTPIDVRVLAASNRRLEEAVEAGRFREDLYYRLSVIPVEVPSLRERREDVPHLVLYFLEEIAARKGWPRARQITQAALRLLEDYEWPGNIRQLKNEVERACLVGGETLSVRDFAHLGGGSAPRSPSGRVTLNATQGALKDLEMTALEKALEETNGNVRRAARRLGIHHSTLYRKLRRAGIDARVYMR